MDDDQLREIADSLVYDQAYAARLQLQFREIRNRAFIEVFFPECAIFLIPYWGA